MDAVRDLRQAFGDPKPPDISRKITACVACRKQKTKCHMPTGTPCLRCKRRGLPCVVNRSLQMILESDSVWKHEVEKKIQTLQDAVERLGPGEADERQSQALPPRTAPDNVVASHVQVVSSPASPVASHWNVTLDPGPGAVPGSYITPATTESTPSAPPSPHVDLVSKGTISLDNARSYFDTYQQRFDHFVYRLLGDEGSTGLEGVREASPLLTAAICTVGALHSASSSDFDACRAELVALAEKQSLSAAGSEADVRGLCLGAFWLPDLAWPLAGAAVRLATSLQLHKSFYRAINNSDDGHRHYLRARLYYHVYACDHHVSIAFGRPPLTRECEAVRQARAFLGCAHATEDDARLVSQVCRWSLLSEVYDAWGVDADRPLSAPDVPRLRHFALALDGLRAEWAERFEPNAHVGNYPRKGVGLQYHFAKLYLCSHAFRGSPTRPADCELDELAEVAVISAVFILRFVVADPEIQSFLDGLPTYFDVMITFAVVFLLRLTSRPTPGCRARLDIQDTRLLVAETAAVLSRVASTMHPRHLLVSVARGIDSLVGGQAQSQLSAPPTAPETSPMDTWDDDFTFDPYFLGGDLSDLGLDFEHANQ